MKASAATWAILGGMLALAPVLEAAEQLHIYNWSDYVADDTIANFQKETGIQVTYDVYDSNEALAAKLAAGNTGFDLVVPTTNFLSKQIAAGAHQKLDRSRLKNYGNLDTKLLRLMQASDPGNAYAVPYLWGTNGIGVNVDKVRKLLGPDYPLDSYDLVFKPEIVAKLSACGVTLLDSPNEVFPELLNYLGLDPNSEKPEDYQRAANHLLRIKPHIRQFHSSQYIDHLASGETCVAYGFSGDVGIAKARAEEAGNGVNLLYIIPKEGTALWFDSLAIPKDAKNVANAHKFIDYILRPEVAAAITNTVTYPNPNTQATSLVDAALREDPNVYPPESVMTRMFSELPKPPAIERLMTRLFTKVKTGH
ncbi:MAG: polyamine ABC transporter substrate-binding protein [Gammaproteobacteria bacterium]|nr:polyamine ABC transporter substrate-binding protein [Gammaproteobacteria bacterium]